MQWDVLASRS